MDVLDPARLRQMRENAHFTQRQLADLCYCSQTRIYQLERGEKKSDLRVTPELAHLIALRLGCRVEHLFLERDDVRLAGMASGYKVRARTKGREPGTAARRAALRRTAVRRVAAKAS
jgi:transcriptional regulator with XRE-family HTH domain